MESKYEQAVRDKIAAENRCIAELFAECCVGNPYVVDKNGNWLTKEQVYEKMLKGDVE